MGKQQKKYYVVWKGRKPGIFESWPDCSRQVTGFPGAKYKSFPTKREAEQAFAGASHQYIGKQSGAHKPRNQDSAQAAGPIRDSISVDAACDGAPGRLEYQAVETDTGKLIFHQGPFDEGTNNVGEFLAIVHAAAYLKEQGSRKPIYSDSRTALAWVRKKRANTSLRQTGRNKHLFKLVEQAEQWLEDNGIEVDLLKWQTAAWGEIPADFGRK